MSMFGHAPLSWLQQLGVMRNRVGQIGEVTFDLRHEGLQPEANWTCPHLIKRDGGFNRGPYTVATPSLGGLLGLGLSEEAIEELQAEQATDPNTLFPGDHVSICEVHRVGIAEHPTLTFEPDREFRRAVVRVTRANGSVNIISPLEFYQAGSLIDVGSDGPSLDVLYPRTDQVFEIAPNGEVWTDASGVGSDAASQAHNLRQSIARLLVELGLDVVEPSMTDLLWSQRRSLERVIDQAAGYGYTQAMLERKITHDGPAESHLGTVRGGGRGGKKGAETRRMKREIWRNEAQRLLPDVLRHCTRPGNMETLITDIQHAWKDDNCPSRGSLRKYFVELHSADCLWPPQGGNRPGTS